MEGEVKMNFNIVCPGSMSSGTGELGEQHTFGVRGRLRPSPWKDRNPSPAPGGDLPVGQSHRHGKYFNRIIKYNQFLWKNLFER